MGINKKKANMHNIDMSFIEMTLDVMKYVIHRLTHTESKIGSPKKESELRKLVGETITKEGIGGEYAFSLFKDIPEAIFCLRFQARAHHPSNAKSAHRPT